MFINSQTKEVADFIASTFMDEAEYLFMDSDTAVFRKGERKKWYAVIMRISKRKLGIDSDDMVEVLNVKLNPNEIALITDRVSYFPAYHMNKKHWCTIVLNNSVGTDEIIYRVEQSYNLVKG
ncbi:MAG: MmcQ/YjbR family DNA-binding protein [Ruminococcus sp.]|nr:MmcQ/YjbR family DNA-binding protein [Ruminococcus sp.]